LNRQFSKEEQQMANKYMKKHSTFLAIRECKSNDTKIPSYASQNGCHQANKQQMVLRIQGKKNPYTLLVRM
jgi:hypothetical protein